MVVSSAIDNKEVITAWLEAEEVKDKEEVEDLAVRETALLEPQVTNKVEVPLVPIVVDAEADSLEAEVEEAEEAAEEEAAVREALKTRKKNSTRNSMNTGKKEDSKNMVNKFMNSFNFSSQRS